MKIFYRMLFVLGWLSQYSSPAAAEGYDFTFEPPPVAPAAPAGAALGAASIALPGSAPVFAAKAEEPAEARASAAAWKITLGASRAFFYNQAGYRYGTEREEQARPSGHLTFYSSARTGASLHFGRFAGLELESHLLDVSRARGRPLLAFTFAALKDMVGYTTEDRTLGAALSRALTTAFGGTVPELTRLSKPLNFFAGAQAGLNVGRGLSLLATYRVAVAVRDGRRPSLAQVGGSYFF